MAGAWNEGQWGDNSWGTDNNTVAVTGVSSTSSIGQSAAFPEFGFGGGEWGQEAWGSLKDTGAQATSFEIQSNTGSVEIETLTDIDLTGLSLSTSLGSVTTTSLEEGWGARTWGFSTWGQVGNARLEGVSASISAEPLSLLNFNALANAQISTDQSKFGGSSLELDGSNDRIQSGDITLGTDSYTWETFAYFNSFSTTQCIWDAGENVGGSKNPVVYITATNIQISYAGGTYINVAHGMSTDTWHHIAIVRDGTGLGNLKAYIDGTNVGTGNLGLVGAGATNHVLGGNFAGTFTMNGYLDESRLTRRVIYTENFTPPSAPFTVDDADIWLLHYDGTNGSQTIVNSAQVPVSPLTITGDANIDVTGIPITSTTGNAASRIDTETSLTTAGLLSSNIGTVDFSISADVSITGSSLSGSIGNADAFNTTGWGRLTWGAADWGEGADETVVLTGNVAASAIGITDQQADGNVFVNVTEHTINTLIGNEDSFTDVDVSVTGQSITSSIGDETAFTDVTISATGLSLSTSIGVAEGGLKTPVDVTTAGLLSVGIGQVDAPDSLAKPTGVVLTSGIGSVTISAWSEVDTGTEVTWSDVDIAA